MNFFFHIWRGSTVCWRNVGHSLTIDGLGDNSLIVGAHVDEEALRLSDEDDGDLICEHPGPLRISFSG